MVSERIVLSQNNPTREEMRLACVGWRFDWKKAAKVTFSMIGGHRVEFSLQLMHEDGQFILLEGRRENGTSVEIDFNFLTGMGTVTDVPIRSETLVCSV